MQVIDLTGPEAVARPRRRARSSGVSRATLAVSEVVDLTASPQQGTKGGGCAAPRKRPRAEVSAPCELCRALVSLSALLAHQEACAARRRAAASTAGARTAASRDSPCPWCASLFTAEALAEHGSRCAALPARFKSGALPLELAAAHAADGVRLTSAQEAAMTHVAARAASASAAALPALRERAKRLGFTADDVQRCLGFIRSNAPLVVHFAADRVLHLLAADTHYRNQFETSASGGALSSSARDTWEADMFSSAYARAPAADKVKYGALNVTCDVRGVMAAHGYGDSYLQLARGVRLRTTFAFYDTGQPETRKCLATCEHYAHVLNAYADAELTAALRVGAGRAPHGASGKAVVQYKEFQVHGPIDLSRHVEALVVNARHRGDKAVCDAVKAFVAKHGTAVLWTDELLGDAR